MLFHFGEESQIKHKPILRSTHFLLFHQILYVAKSSVADPDTDPQNFGNLDPDPHQMGMLDLDSDSHQSEKVEALEGHFRALDGPNLVNSEW